MRAARGGAMCRTLGTLLPALILEPFAYAQSNDAQIWADGIIGRNFAGNWMFETEFSYQALLSEQDRWESLNLTPSLECSITPHWDLVTGVPLSYTIQNNSFNTSELRLMFGSRFTFTPFKRVQTRTLIRYEGRYVRNEDTEAVEESDRLRVRAEVAMPLDNINWHADTMWYTLADVEAFFSATDVQERFANRLRSRIGIGRKFSYNWRLEFIYTLQNSRATLEGDELTTDHIFRFRLKYYMTPRVRKRHDAGGTGT